ncbi:uncharacterized protein METZ01_LOCUS296202 [marine metagenome]|uniref:Uncharacterized protein n=1 Tax=marine metagenome TaxID=408172 RepID=A0A382M422_9ZZZZ|tara:strand:+ start:294 stop:719 length:426 start_codon:yes stop_codon:yes gene_type:complete
MISDDLEMKGRLVIQINDEIVQEVDNLVVTVGKNYVASRIKDATATAMSHMAVGTNSTAAAAGDTALGTEAGRAALTSTTVSTNTVTYVGTFAAGTGTGALVEAGILNASSSGTLLCRTVYTTVNKGANDSMTITWVITVS